MANLLDIEGIGDAFAEKLKSASVTTIEDLLQTGSTKAGRSKLAETCGVSEGQILQWVNHADLFRIKGIGSEFSDLLEAAGVDTVMELAQRNGANLAAKLAEINDQKKLTRRVPTAAELTDWIEQAKKLPRVVTY